MFAKKGVLEHGPRLGALWPDNQEEPLPGHPKILVCNLAAACWLGPPANSSPRAERRRPASSKGVIGIFNKRERKRERESVRERERKRERK